VSFVKVDGEGVFERISGTNLGGGTFWGLCRLLTRVRSFDKMLQLSSQGDSRKVDMLVGDIYGGKDYQAIGLSADTIASSFGKVVSQEKELEDYNPAGAHLIMILSCCVSINIVYTLV
jgi:bifunctional damage-control phosphatase, subfamily II, fusion protein